MEKIKKREILWEIVIVLVSVLVSFGILSTTIVNKKYELKIGDISPVDFRASSDVEDEVSTSSLIEDAQNSIQNQYTENPEVRRAIIRVNTDFFNRIITAKAVELTNDERSMELEDTDTYGISAEEYLLFLNVSNEGLRGMLTGISNTVNVLYAQAIEEDDLTQIEMAKDTLSKEIEAISGPEEMKEVLRNLTLPLVKPNFIYNDVLTKELKAAAVAKVNPVLVTKNQTIVKEGEPIREYQLALLGRLGYLTEGEFNYLPFIGLGLGVLVIHLLIVFYLNKYYKEIMANKKMLLLILSIFVVFLGITRVMTILSPYAVPYTFVPMLVMILIKKRIGQTLALFSCVLASIIVGFNPQVILILMVTSVLSIIFLKRVEERNDIVKSSFFVGIAAFLVSTGFGLILSNSVMDIMRNGGIVVAACVVSGVTVIGVLPIFENMFNIVTEIKLLELSNPNNPLLKRLQMEAPGTYQHSIMVGNLAVAAGEELNANTILLRVGAYFHDIGKLSRPQFFKENQIGMKNPHNDITPNLSTLIILNHVKIGLEMAEKAKLPEEIKDMITQHHGTTLVKYFYLTLRNRAENPDDIKEEDFRYPGPKPKTKEAGIMMLADSIEASVRSLTEPSEGKIQEMVYRIIRDKLDDGQLEECELTFSELNTIRKSFLKTLGSMYHERIEYPEDKRKKLARQV
ncbi:MAG TPA: HDIG domain-containing protein [Clostridiaceae bacterium]|nr:HDIG domain-containing protein [Clostridiaceae bacterium]